MIFYVYGIYYWIVAGHYLDWVYDVVLVGVLCVEVYFWLRFRGVLGKRI